MKHEQWKWPSKQSKVRVVGLNVQLSLGVMLSTILSHTRAPTDTQGMYRELKSFIEESVLMCSFNHPHVLGMLGICLDTVLSPHLLLPYMVNGDLRTFMRNKRDVAKASDTGYPEVDDILVEYMRDKHTLGQEYSEYMS